MAKYENIDNELETQLYQAIKKGNAEEVTALIEEEGADLYAKDRDGNTLLHLAVKEGHEEIVKLFVIDYDINPNIKNMKGDTAIDLAVQQYKGKEAIVIRLLYHAPKKDHKRIIDFLLESGFDLRSTNNIDETVLMWAAEQCKEEVVTLLLVNVTDLYKKQWVNASLRDGETALYYAVTRGDVAIVRILLAHGADPKFRGKDGNTALHYAAMQSSEMVAALLESEVDPDEKQKWVNANNDCGNTALHTAAEQGEEAVVKLLLKAGADPNARNDYCRTPLQSTFWQWNNQSVVELLLSNGADVKAKDKEGKTVFEYDFFKFYADTISRVQRGTPLVR